MIVRSLYNVSRQMNVLQEKQENNAANTANVNTPGFKYQELVQSAMKEYEICNHAGGKDDNQKQQLGSINFGTEIDEAHTDFSQGAFKQTGLYTDLAISGNGFFSVELEDGTMGFTRNGNFKVDDKNQLVTQEGYQVLATDDQGNICGINVKNDRLEVDKNGYINGTSTKVMTVDFPDYGAFELKGNTVYVSGMEKFQPTDCAISQGFIESSNVSMMDEMVNMMQVSREFETNQRALKVINETLQKTVNDIGRN
jgi:flagellar basal-body rod protein FlgF